MVRLKLFLLLSLCCMGGQAIAAPLDSQYSGVDAPSTGVTEQHQIPRGRAYMLWQKKQLEQEKDYFLAHKNDPLSPGGSMETVHPLLSHTSPRPSDLTVAVPTEKSKDKK